MLPLVDPFHSSVGHSSFIKSIDTGRNKILFRMVIKGKVPLPSWKYISVFQFFSIVNPLNFPFPKYFLTNFPITFELYNWFTVEPYSPFILIKFFGNSQFRWRYYRMEKFKWINIATVCNGNIFFTDKFWVRGGGLKYFHWSHPYITFLKNK